MGIDPSSLRNNNASQLGESLTIRCAKRKLTFKHELN